MPEPAPNVLLLLGMAAASWAAIGIAGLALWPGQSDVQPVNMSVPLAVRDDPSPVTAVHDHQIAVADPAKRRPTAKQAVRRKSKVAAKRRSGPSFAARVFAATTY
jgi:hypothetical protein